MTELILRKLSLSPEWIPAAAEWFSQKWGLPADEYRRSMEQADGSGPPEWFVLLCGGEIAAGAGLIENDFHDRPDLRPNLCALFVEECFRGQGLARRLLWEVRREAGRMGCEKLFLVTEHPNFYERLGWRFVTLVRGSDGGALRLYEADTLLGDEPAGPQAL